jgi:O-antigen/teichoic acid export membrane protein
MIVLARLLEPRDFGLMALATLVIALVSQFSGLGLAAALVVRRDLGERVEGTALTLVLAGRAFGSAAMIGFAPLIADAFGEPRLTNLLYALSVVGFLSGPNYFYTTLIERELAFKKRFYVVAVQALVSAVAVIVLAAAGAGVWSLVVSTIVGSAVYGVGVFLLAPHRPTPAFDRASARVLAPLARGFFVQNAASFFQENMDYIAVGRLLGSRALGLYSLAYRLGDLPRTAIAHPVGKVTFPIFAKMRDEGREVGPSFIAVLRLLALAAFPLCVLMSASADPLVRVAFGDRWLPMVSALSIFGVWAAARVLQASLEWFLNSVGLAGVSGRLSVVALAFHVPALVLAAEFGSIETVSWVMLASVCLFLALLSLGVSRGAGIRVRDQVAALSVLFVAGVAGWLTTRGVVVLLVAQPPVELVASWAAGLVVYFAAVWLGEPGLPRAALDVAGRALRRAPVEQAIP